MDAADSIAVVDDGAVDVPRDVSVDGGPAVDTSIFCDKDCDDKNPCTDDVCYIQIGCTHIPHSGKCDDGNACTTGDFCTGDTCAGEPMACDDGNACTEDACVLPGTCTHTSHC